MRRLVRAVVLLAAGLSPLTSVRAGHEFPFYPSFYPQEITLEAVGPDRAAPRLAAGELHAYVGQDLFTGRTPPPDVARVESLGSYVVVTLNPATAFFPDRTQRCRVADAVLGRLATGAAHTVHPYPVTPYHPDFLSHADLADAAKRRHTPEGGAPQAPRIRAAGEAAARLVPGALPPGEPSWDATVETIDVADLWTRHAGMTNGWSAPPWLKDGWYHAYLVLAGAVSDPAAREEIERLAGRRTRHEYATGVERLNLERQLVTRLRAGCERVVAGYTTRRESVYAAYSGGVENVAADAQAGLRSPIFPRTVKLKDFPWNGWLNVGVGAPSTAAWNPIAGFGDPAGALVWMAVGDPALFPSPLGAGWVPNRVTLAESHDSGAKAAIEVPADALVPEPGTGRLQRVGPNTRVAARLRYRVLTSKFHDGTPMTAADILYAFAFAHRWGASAAGASALDPDISASTALMRQRLAGLHVVRVETDVLAFGDTSLTYRVPIVDVYLKDHPADVLEAPALAPPWSTLPWHVLVLMEEAVLRGRGAFSRAAAARRGVPWLDLVRDAGLRAALLGLVDEFARRGYVPEALRSIVPADEARARWAALRTFQDEHHHFLVANGPYLLHQWSPASTVLRVFRDLSYPRGVGAFNVHAMPLRARVSAVELRARRLTLRADVDKVERFGREHQITSEPFVKKTLVQDKRTLPVCHYVVVAPDGGIVQAGTAAASDASTFDIELTATATGEVHTVLVALSLDGNLTHLPVKAIPWTP